MFLMLPRLFIAAFVVTCWDRAELLLVMFFLFLLLSHVVSWVMCGTLLYRFLIYAVFLTMTTGNVY